MQVVLANPRQHASASDLQCLEPGPLKPRLVISALHKSATHLCHRLMPDVFRVLNREACTSESHRACMVDPMHGVALANCQDCALAALVPLGNSSIHGKMP